MEILGADVRRVADHEIDIRRYLVEKEVAVTQPACRQGSGLFGTCPSGLEHVCRLLPAGRDMLVLEIETVQTVSQR